jgi:hypothetical protein
VTSLPELVLHAGLPHTGATMVGRALGRLRAQLRSHGIVLIRHGALAELPAAAGWRARNRVDETAAATFEQQLAVLVAREAAEVRAIAHHVRAVVITSDQLLGQRNLDARDEQQLRPAAVPAIAQVARALPAARTRVLLTVRRQDRLLEASHLCALANGATTTLDERFPRRAEPVLDLGGLADRLASLPDVDAVRVRPSERVAASAVGGVDDVLRALRLSGRLDLSAIGDDPGPDRLYSARAAAIAEDVNPLLDDDRDRRLVRRFLLEQFPAGAPEDLDVLTADERTALLVAYAEVNRQLFARWMPHLPIDAYADEAATDALAATRVDDAALLSSEASTPAVRERLAAPLRRAGTVARTLRATPEERRDQLAAEVERRRLLGTVRSETTAEVPPATAGLLHRVAEALDDARIAHLMVPAGPDRPLALAVAEDSRAGVTPALRPLAGTVRLAAGSPTADLLDAADEDPTAHHDSTADAERWSIVAAPADDLAEDPEPTVELWFLPTDVADREPAWWWRWEGPADVPHRGASGVVPLEIGGRTLHAPRTLRAAPRVGEVTFPIDVVYTWVDGADPAWRARKDAAARSLDPTAVDADADARFHDHDELRYSLRSLARYAPFVRDVVLVTDRQVPPWLDTEHPRIRIVDHRDLLPPHCLPTFNSHAIETRLHHIPGLAEHFLYLNDDFFFGREVEPERFFEANGATRFFRSPARIPAGDDTEGPRSVDAAARNAQRLVREHLGRVVEHKIKHAPYAQRRSVLFELEETFRDALAATASRPLRSAEDVPVPSALAHHYGYLTGRAVPGRIRSEYVSLDDPALARRLRAVGRSDAEVLCINDTVAAHRDDLTRRTELLRRFMAATWPTPSPFER